MFTAFFYKLHEKPIHVHPSSVKIIDLQVLLGSLAARENPHPSNNIPPKPPFPSFVHENKTIFWIYESALKKEYFC